MPEEKKHAIEEPLEPLIFSVRGHRVILDADLARIYGVSTKALNQSVKRNAQRFPADFAFQLSTADLAELRSRVASSNRNTYGIQRHSSNRSQFVTGSQKAPKLSSLGIR
jgi:ORF6N domain-containing protein